MRNRLPRCTRRQKPLHNALVEAQLYPALAPVTVTVTVTVTVKTTRESLNALWNAMRIQEDEGYKMYINC